jgi:hypothetical protein
MTQTWLRWLFGSPRQPVQTQTNIEVPEVAPTRIEFEMQEWLPSDAAGSTVLAHPGNQPGLSYVMVMPASQGTHAEVFADACCSGAPGGLGLLVILQRFFPDSFDQRAVNTEEDLTELEAQENACLAWVTATALGCPLDAQLPEDPNTAKVGRFSSSGSLASICFTPTPSHSGEFCAERRAAQPLFPPSPAILSC